MRQLAGHGTLSLQRPPALSTPLLGMGPRGAGHVHRRLHTMSRLGQTQPRPKDRTHEPHHATATEERRTCQEQHTGAANSWQVAREARVFRWVQATQIRRATGADWAGRKGGPSLGQVPHKCPRLVPDKPQLTLTADRKKVNLTTLVLKHRAREYNQNTAIHGHVKNKTMVLSLAMYIVSVLPKVGKEGRL